MVLVELTKSEEEMLLRKVKKHAVEMCKPEVEGKADLIHFCQICQG